MDCRKVGALILNLRKEKNMTQKEVADRLNISDKTVSKWERGMGCPDVTLLGDLSNILGVNVEKILLGSLEEKETDGGNMKQIKFYVCKNCGNIITSTSETEISCCGKKLNSLVIQPQDEDHKITVTDIDNEYYVTIDHPMDKTHYVSFVAFVGFDRIVMIKLYPEQNAELYIPKMQRGKLYAYCSQHGFWEKKI
ncbi:putative desulfoferrodoxin [Clostridium aceticum]|uniref:Putative desulfoferrodoxin n=1 Tax=Clostridium aceticum TaxID=84022 RepID=A0A0D8IAP0_9CLOT|nr:helix-turn-helix domain-containing protein [Clostridium aceticum]AKL96493.1 putative desulfoferrodoxin [Clostridium aceticum]KJF27335.1 XRE family transcriptional regulator [Clostridium aceticum]